MELSFALARRLALYRQGLLHRWSLPAGAAGAAQVIERLGYVQIDTISVIQRAHHHTLWARQPEYQPPMLNQLLHERKVFEWWTHAAAYIPLRDYRYYLSRMRAAREREQTRAWRQENAQLVQNVLQRIRAEGPLGAADFKAPEGFKRGTWWSWKPAKRALEMLFDSGELMVSTRRNFQRRYDLRERFLPPHIDTSEPEPDEVNRFLVRRALGGLGFADIKDVRWGRQKPGKQAVQELLEAGELVSFTIKGLDGSTFVALKETLDQVSNQPHPTPSLHILSPFDNLTIRRRWLEKFFAGFRYRLEAYLPAAKRQYGYFTLPLLWGDCFVGRADCKADRKPKTFIVRRVTFEPEFKEFERLLPVLVEKLRAFAVFNGCEQIVVERTVPEKVLPLVKILV